MKIGGWKTRSIFERYAIVSQGDVEDALSKLEESKRRAKQRLATSMSKRISGEGTSRLILISSRRA